MYSIIWDRGVILIPAKFPIKTVTKSNLWNIKFQFKSCHFESYLNAICINYAISFLVSLVFTILSLSISSGGILASFMLIYGICRVIEVSLFIYFFTSTLFPKKYFVAESKIIIHPMDDCIRYVYNNGYIALFIRFYRTHCK